MFFRRASIGLASTTALVFVFSDQVIGASLALALASRERSLTADEPRIALTGLHTRLVTRGRPLLAFRRANVQLPGVATISAENLEIEFASRAALYAFLFPAAGAERSIALIAADAVELKMTQQVLLSFVAGSASAGVAVTGSLVSAVGDAAASVVNVVVGASGPAKAAAPADSPVTLQVARFADVCIRLVAPGGLELPTVLRVPRVEIARMRPSIQSLPLALLDFVSILVRTVVASSASSVGNLVAMLTPATSTADQK